MIYGAAFSWNGNILSFDEINRQISRLEFGDEEEVRQHCRFCGGSEGFLTGRRPSGLKSWERFRNLQEDHKAYISEHLGDMDGVDEKNERLGEISREFYGQYRSFKGRQKRACEALSGSGGCRPPV